MKKTLTSVVLWSEIIDFGLRILLVFGIHYLKLYVDANPDFYQAILILRSSVIMNTNNLDDTICFKMNQFCYKLRNLFGTITEAFTFNYCLEFCLIYLMCCMVLFNNCNT